MKKKKITKNNRGYVIITDDKDNFIVAIPPGQYIHLYEFDIDAIYITDALSGVNRVMIQTSEISEVFGNAFSGDRDALVKLLAENFSFGSGGGSLDPKAYDLADFKNGSADTFVRKSDENFWRTSGNPNTSYSPDGRILNYVGGLMQTVLGVVDYNKLTERLADNPRLKAIDDALNDIQIKQQQLYDDFDSGKITAEEFNQKREEFSREVQDLYQQRTVVFNEEAAKLKDAEGLQVLTLNNDSATFFKPVKTTNSIQATYYNDKISIWETRLGFYENGSYKYGYDGSEFIQHLKDINTTVRISSDETMYNAIYSKDVVARYPNGTIAFLSSALDSSLKKFVSAPYSSGTSYLATDKNPVFTNLQNADGDSTFNRELVANSYGVIGSRAISGSIKRVSVSFIGANPGVQTINETSGDLVSLPVYSSSPNDVYKLSCALNNNYNIRQEPTGFGGYDYVAKLIATEDIFLFGKSAADTYIPANTEFSLKSGSLYKVFRLYETGGLRIMEL